MYNLFKEQQDIFPRRLVWLEKNNNNFLVITLVSKKNLQGLCINEEHKINEDEN